VPFEAARFDNSVSESEGQAQGSNVAIAVSSASETRM
jgi:hypothetical protein